MISICIPIYNFDVNNLVKQLSLQMEHLDVPSEIILIDDCSDSSFKNANKKVCQNEVYIELGKNIGRAAIRNRFLNDAKYNNLLFLDCDSVIYSSNFLLNYIHAINKNPNQLICGGRIYKELPPKRDKKLRWIYGVKRESKNAVVRSKKPNKSFMTNNFIIGKELLETIKFDERLVEYGHEDTLFGFELKKRDIGIIHIENPILNGHLENNISYISNTEKAVCNLTHILEYTNYDKGFIEDVELLRIYYKLHKVRNITKILFLISKHIIKYFLSNGYINLYLFDFYKLGIFTHKMSKSPH